MASSKHFIAKTLEPFLVSHPKRVIIFDFDETLCHLHLPWGKYAKVVHEYLRKKDEDLFDNLIRQNRTSQVFNHFVEKYGQEIWKFDRKVSAEFESNELEAAPCDHTLLDWIVSRSDQYLFFIWSSNCTTTILPVLDAEGAAVRDAFERVIGKDSVRLTKPHKDGFEKIAAIAKEKCGDVLKQSDFLMVGDNLVDDKGAAENAGIAFLHHHHFVETE